MDNNKGLSLVELMVGLIVTGIIVLMVAALGSLAYKSYNGLRSNSGVYNDSQFALQIIREAVRRSTGAPTTPTSTCLEVPVTSTTNDYFYRNGTNSLIYSITGPCGNTTSATNRTIISAGVTNLTFTPNVSALPLVNVILSATNKNGATLYSYSIYVTRRNP